MKAIILGSGDSLLYYEYHKHFGAYVIGANDAIKDTPTLNAVACADPYRDIQAKRPKALDTPKHIEIWGRQGAGWEAFAKERGNVHIVPTRRFNIHWEAEYLNKMKGQYFHGYHTPFFCASIAMNKGYDELYFYGLDGDCFSARNCYTIIKELNALHDATKGVWLCRQSALWQIQYHDDCYTTKKNSSEKVRIELKCNEI